MRLLLSWVRDFVDVTAPAEQVADTLALRGFEVAALERLGGDDAVIDFEVTANRPDCLSVVGFARELATTFDLPLRLPSAEPGSPIPLAPVKAAHADQLRVHLEDPERCPRYVAATAEVVRTTTPGWMRERLQAAGVRAISPVVDVTNYVLMELGHPMHAFDLQRLEHQEIRVRRAHTGESITTLDGVARTLTDDMLVIADARRAQAIAGVMGGASSEVSDATHVVAFESAYFQPASVRRTSRRLGVKTEASARFERGTDVNAPLVALQRALALMQQAGARGATGGVIDLYPRPRGPLDVVVRRGRLDALLGLHVPDADVERILGGLGLHPSRRGDGWVVRVPTFRVDVLREVDLIEEVGRHYGYDRIDAAFPSMTAPAAAPDPRVSRDQLVRRSLTAAGLSEAITFAFIETDAAGAFASRNDREQLVPLANPLSAKFAVLRPSLIPGLLAAVAHNRRHGRRDVALFELGSHFGVAAGETHAVGLAWTGASRAEHWSGGTTEVDLFDVKGALECLAAVIGVSVYFSPARSPFLVAGQSADVRVGDVVVGVAGLALPAVVDRAGAPRQDKVFVAELDLDRLAALVAPTDEHVQPLPRHPFVVRDLSIVVPATLPATIIRDTIQAAGAAAAVPLTSVAVFDRYQGRGVPDGSVSISVRLTFQAADRTLTDPEVQQAFDGILAALVHAHGAVQR
jgi:phenylalanyl-tRNA synthetase beta chain